ncbi:MAG: hypothetical protein L7S64_08690 [Longimicrobiales bacterium]|nr:hypothetical protein [Longimicrobiales bacterium]
MEELIFFAVIIFFSIIESIARSRKQKKGGGTIEESPTADQDPAEWEFEWAPESPAELPTYDQDPSYDEQPSYDDRATRSGTVPPPAPRGVEAGKPSSRTLLSGGLLEELAGMAERLEGERERMEQAATRSGQKSWEEETRAEEQRDWEEQQERRQERDRVRRVGRESRSTRSTHRGPARPRPTHLVHSSHAEYGTDPSERSRSEQDGLDPLARTLSADAIAIRRQLTSNSASALRQAVILQEVLGPPKAMREDPA